MGGYRTTVDRAAEEHDWQTLEDTGEAWRYFGNPVQGEEWRTSLRRHARRLHRPIPTGRAVQHQEGSLPLLVVAALDGVSWQWICRSFPEFQPPDSGTWPTESWYWAILRDWWERKPVDEQRRLLRAVREMVWKSILATPHEGLLPVPATEVPYRTANEDVHAVKRDPFVVDPNIVDRGLRGHAVTQNALADFLVSSGLNPVSPGIQHPDFDLGWLQGDTFYVAEVKSLTKENESTHLRLGLGQVLYYRYRLEQTAGLESANALGLCWSGLPVSLDFELRTTRGPPPRASIPRHRRPRAHAG